MEGHGIEAKRNVFDTPSPGDVVILRPDKGRLSKLSRRFALEGGALARVLGPDNFEGRQFEVVKRYYNEASGAQRLVLKPCPQNNANISDAYDVEARFFMVDKSAPSFLVRKKIPNSG